MKIICVGRNYINHTKELNNEIPTEPVIFLKPETALVKDNYNIYLPEFTQDMHYEVELVVKICEAGKHIRQEYAQNYYQEIALGIDFTARDLQNKLKEKGLPWERAKAFDNSALVGEFIPMKNMNIENISFHLNINEVTRQKGNSKDMMFSINTLISDISKFITLKKGDLIYTGTPEGVGKLNEGDKLQGFLNDELNFIAHIK